jgi:hypothetical protein
MINIIKKIDLMDDDISVTGVDWGQKTSALIGFIKATEALQKSFTSL